MNAPLGWVPGLRLNLLRFKNDTPQSANPGGVGEAETPMTKRKAEQANEQATNSREEAEQVRSEALRRYGKAIFNATQVYEAELERLANEAGIQVRDVPKPPPEYRTAQTILSKMGMVFQRAATDGSINEEGMRLFRLLSEGLRPPVNAKNSGHAVRRAVEIVDGYARAFLGGPEADRKTIVRLAIKILASEVHVDLGRLSENETAVGELFDRYIESTPRAATGRAPRKRKAGVAGALTAVGILCELNRMVRSPLGLLTRDGVDHAISRKK